MKLIFSKKIGIFLIVILLLIISICFGFYLFSKKNINNNFSELIIRTKDTSEIKKIFVETKKIQKTKEKLLKDKNIESVSDNNTYSITAYPNDPEYRFQNYLKQIKAEDAWTWANDASDIIVAVIDTGIDYNHPDLKDNIWKNGKEIENDGIDNDNNGYVDDYYGWDFVNSTSDNSVKLSVNYSKYAVNHGTVVAGIIGAVGGNKEGITGIAWNIKIMSLRALDSQGNGNTYNVSRAIDYAVKNGADIINLSFVGSSDDEVLKGSIERAYQAGATVVASSGNEAGIGVDVDIEPKYPICYDLGKNTVIGVGSVDKNNEISKFSNYGTKCIDIMAPGENIYSTQVYQPQLSMFQEKYGTSWTGTSFATPMVSATIALIKSIDKTFSNEEIIEILKAGAKNISFINFGHRKQIGAGLLDVNQTLLEARKHKLNKEISIITSSNYSSNFDIKTFNQKTNSISEKTLKSIYGYNKIEAGDINGDGRQEIITMKTSNSGTTISTYSSDNFKLLGQFKIKFIKIPSITIGDLYGTKRDKIIIGHPNEPKISIYEYSGQLLNTFYAYDKKFKIGVSVAMCDYDNDKQNEIITAPGLGGGPHIKIFDKNGGLKDAFFAGNEKFRGGLNIDCQRDNFSNEAKIVVAPKNDSSSYILVYNSNGQLENSFMAYAESYKKEVFVKLYDVDFDYQNEIITAPGLGGGPHIKIFETNGTLNKDFFAYNKNDKNGAYISILKKNE